MKIWFVFGLLLASSLAVAQEASPPPLLTPVDDVTRQHVTRPTNYDLREELYLARRYGIVTVNFQLLEKQHSVFTISPWSDVSVEVATETVSGPASFPGNRQWHGRVLSPVPEALAKETDPVKLEAAERLLGFSAWITARAVDVPRSIVQRRAEGQRDSLPSFGNAPASAVGVEQGAVQKMSVTTATFDLPLPYLGTQLRLRPIKSDPRYHVVYELDPSKMVFGPQAEANRQRYIKFKEELDRERKAKPNVDAAN